MQQIFYVLENTIPWGGVFRLAREQGDISREWLARESHVSARTIVNYESGRVQTIPANNAALWGTLRKLRLISPSTNME